MKDEEKVDEYSMPVFFLMLFTGVIALGFAAWSVMR